MTKRLNRSLTPETDSYSLCYPRLRKPLLVVLPITLALASYTPDNSWKDVCYMLEFTEPLAPVYLEVRGLLPTLLRISAVVARVVT